tara:strand:- start:1638 stop:2159 length:522 start_codon:yes stop_codon:yes gene_type:complete
MKAKRNYSYKKASRLINGIISETLTDMARYQNQSIQQGIDTSTDINGKKFKKLSEASTLPIRQRRMQGFTPLQTMKIGNIGASGADLQSSKSLRATKIIKAKQSSLISKVIMVNKHGVYHNQKGGFTTGGMIKGAKVEQREWFGMTKDMKAGGSQYKKFVKMTMTKIKNSLKK